MKRTPLEKFTAVITLKEIAKENDYNLNISRYVDTTVPEEEIDVQEALNRLAELEKKRDEAERKMKKHLRKLGFKL